MGSRHRSRSGSREVEVEVENKEILKRAANRKVALTVENAGGGAMSRVEEGKGERDVGKTGKEKRGEDDEIMIVMII